MRRELRFIAWVLLGPGFLLGTSALAADEVPPQQACYLKCVQPMQDCQKKCGKRARCLAVCAKALGECTDGCGGPPKPPPTPPDP